MTVDIVALHLILNRMFYYPIMASFGYTINPFMPSVSKKGTVVNSIDPDQMPQNTASDLGQLCIRNRNLYNK